MLSLCPTPPVALLQSLRLTGHSVEMSSPGYVGGTINASVINVPFVEAIDSLSRKDADTVFVFLALNGSYLSPVLDPWVSDLWKPRSG